MKRIFTPIKKKTILVVDDDQVWLHLCIAKFQHHGFKIEIVENSDNAIQRIGNDPIDLVIFDLGLPGMNGVEALRNIRAQRQTLPIIAFSNSYIGSLGRAALEAGANKCIAKSEMTPDSLLELVRELLGGSTSSTNELAVPSETQLEEKLVAAVLAKAPDALAKLRTNHQVLAKAQLEPAQQTELSAMHRQLRSLAGSIDLLGFHKIAQMATALEALLIELAAKPEKISPSVVRTIAQAIDTLASLFDRASQSKTETSAAPKILIVDDEIISRETISSALGKANLAAASVDDPLAAQRLLGEERFDLIFLDVEMPGMTGLQLCVKIREMPTNSSTPVVFVTSHSDFGSRAQSTLSGGNDFIAKPFLLVELAVKALTWLFKKTPLSPATPPMRESASAEAQPLADHAAFSIHER